MQKNSILSQLERFQDQCDQWDMEPFGIVLVREEEILFANKTASQIIDKHKNPFNIKDFVSDSNEVTVFSQRISDNIAVKGWYRFSQNYQSYIIVFSSDINDDMLKMINDSFFYSNIFDHIEMPLARLDEHGNIKSSNRAFTRAFALSRQGQNLLDSQKNHTLSKDVVDMLRQKRRKKQIDLMDGYDVLSYIVHIQEFEDLTGSIDYLVQINDITELKKGDEELWMWAHIFDKSKRGMLILNKSWEIVTINESFTETTGFGIDYLYQKHYSFLLCNPNDYNPVWEKVHQEGYWEGETIRRRLDGSTYSEWTEIQAIHNMNEQVMYYYVTINDLSQKIEHEERVKFLMHYDTLTGVPNRHTLLEYLNNHIDKNLVLVVFDVNRFKNVNDSLGHLVGDELLKNIVQRAQTYVSEHDLLARLHGDQFALALLNVNENSIERIIQSLLVSMNAEFFVSGHNIRVSVSVGYAKNCSLSPSSTAHTLLKNAEIALAEAKKDGYSHIMAFSEEIQRIKNERIRLEENMRHAIEQEQFFLVYQPKIDIKTRQLIGMEALLRWRHPVDGLISPMDFIPIAEETNLIVPIGEWVFEEACRQLKQWKINGVDISGRIAVNISAVQFHDPHFLENIHHILKRHGISGDNLELEVTESVIMQNPDVSTPIMKELKNIGFTIAIDDFGTGYSNLNYLSNYPLDVLKIDQSFIRGLQEKNANEAIVKAILTLGKSLNLKIVAEGVEDKWHLDFLAEQGCDIAQGFGIARPMVADTFETWMENYVFLKKK